jgi:prepilin-type N-terminal cleavage/methylation domain-containing protein
MTALLRPQPSQAQAGYTLLEMVMVMAIFGLLFVTPITLSRSVIDREQFNGLALGLASWLEAIQRGAQRTTGGCTVTFSTGVNTIAGINLKPGDTLATVTPSNCTNESSFVIPEFRADATLTARIGTGTLSGNNIDFTPRGTIVQRPSSNSLAANGPTVIFSLTKANIARCVRISHTSGMVTIGANNSGNSCTPISYDGSI